MKKILVYGFGNPGRKDDGLGIHLTEHLEKWADETCLSQIDFDTNYQLNIEDAYELKQYEMVLFADASMEDIPCFIITEVTPSNKVNFTTHSVSPSFLLHLAKEMFCYCPKAYLLHIKGYEWQLEEGLSNQASVNLHKSLLFTKNLLKGFLRKQNINNEISMSHLNTAS